MPWLVEHINVNVFPASKPTFIMPARKYKSNFRNRIHPPLAKPNGAVVAWRTDRSSFNDVLPGDLKVTDST